MLRASVLPKKSNQATIAIIAFRFKYNHLRQSGSVEDCKILRKTGINTSSGSEHVIPREMNGEARRLPRSFR